MAKAKKRSRASKSRSNPLNSAPKDESKAKAKIMPLLANIKSTVPNERAMALSSITLLCEDPYYRQLFLKEKLVSTLTENMLNDSNDEIVVEAFGLLRNLSVDEGYDVCIFLWRNQIWQAIEAKLVKIDQSFNFIKENEVKDKEGQRLFWDLVENIISLICALGKGSDQILDELVMTKSETLFGLCNRLLDFKLPIRLLNAMLDFIYEFSTESGEFIEGLMSAIDVTKLNIQGNEQTAVLLQGIQLQVLDFQQLLDIDQCVAIWKQLLSIISSIDISKVMETLVREVDNTIKDDLLTEKIEARSRLYTLEIALDLITALFELVGSNEDQEISEELVSLLVGDIRNTLISLSSNYYLKGRCLVALNNMLWFLQSVGYDETALFQEVWSAVPKDDDAEFKPVLAGLLWACVQCGVIPENTEYYIQEFTSTDDQEYKQRLVGLLSAISKLDVNINKVIGDAFLQHLATDNVEVNMDIISQLFVIYGDKSYPQDINFKNGNYLGLLQEALPVFRHQCKMVDKNKDPVLREKAMDVAQTLVRFISYKQNE